VFIWKILANMTQVSDVAPGLLLLHILLQIEFPMFVLLTGWISIICTVDRLNLHYLYWQIESPLFVYFDRLDSIVCIFWQIESPLFVYFDRLNYILTDWISIVLLHTGQGRWVWHYKGHKGLNRTSWEKWNPKVFHVMCMFVWEKWMFYM
jgi:hypothetical protein